MAEKVIEFYVFDTNFDEILESTIVTEEQIHGADLLNSFKFALKEKIKEYISGRISFEDVLEVGVTLLTYNAEILT